MLTTTSEYALRALAALACLPRGSSKLGRELARDADIPSNYLSKILVALRNAGLVATARGSGGGYWLLRPADAVHLVDVVELFEGVGSTRTCILGHNKPCNEKESCSAHERWRNVKELYLEFLEKTTLADISTVSAARRRGAPISITPAAAATGD
jgi:Rrf2 family protein